MIIFCLDGVLANFDNNEPIEPVINLWNSEISQGLMGLHQIWCSRCESVRKKTEEWLNNKLICFESHQLKMRPIGDNTPEHELKELWLEETYEETKFGRRSSIDFVFESDPNSIEMWRTRGIFVFDCNQDEKEYLQDGNMNNEILEIKSPPSPYGPDDKIFYYSDEDGNQIGKPYSQNDYIQLIKNMSGITEDLMGTQK